jgi:hypothetical protein
MGLAECAAGGAEAVAAVKGVAGAFAGVEETVALTGARIFFGGSSAAGTSDDCGTGNGDGTLAIG